jgi:hypothetical protein
MTQAQAFVNNVDFPSAISSQAPFKELCHELAVRLDLTSFSEVQNLGLCLGAHLLNSLSFSARSTQSVAKSFTFTDQSHYQDDSRYYEQIIFEDKKIPTRANYHDFFNGVIWQQFPQTKSLLNQLHQHEIAQHGVKKRSKLRDKITHFDECGLLILTDQNDFSTSLRQHQWQEVFVKQRGSWHHDIQAVIFGHAMWEMLMQPFIGLTAKALVINVESQLLQDIQLKQKTKTAYEKRYSAIDSILHAALTTGNVLEEQKPFSPIPILGIPNWSVFEQNTAFYSNAQYFMPLTIKKRQS